MAPSRPSEPRPEPRPEPRHAAILAEFRQKIVEGAWPPGRKLAKETDLAAQYGVSRMTMNKVLTQLAQDGFVQRRKRSGTFVAKVRVQSAVMEINNPAHEVEALGRRYGWSLTEAAHRRATASDLGLLGVTEALEEGLFLQGVHLADGEPFCLEARVINPAVVPAALEVDFAVEAPGGWLQQVMPWSAARHVVRAVNAAGRDAKALGLPAGTACLEILRRTEMDAAWVTHARLLYPGDQHQLTAEFEPGPAAEAPMPRG